MTVRNVKASRGKRAAPKNGDSRIGRPAMFGPKDRDRHRSTYMTDEGWALTERLRQYHRDKVGFNPSDGDVFEDAVRARAKQVGIA